MQPDRSWRLAGRFQWWMERARKGRKCGGKTFKIFWILFKYTWLISCNSSIHLELSFFLNLRRDVISANGLQLNCFLLLLLNSWAEKYRNQSDWDRSNFALFILCPVCMIIWVSRAFLKLFRVFAVPVRSYRTHLPSMIAAAKTNLFTFNRVSVVHLLFALD